MKIKDGTPTSHAAMMSDIEKTPGAEFLQGHLVVRGRSNLVSRVILRKGGLKDLLASVRNPSSHLHISGGVEASTACTLLAGQIGLACHNHNISRVDRGLKPLPYGVKVWVGEALGVYITIGTQDLEVFFGRK